MPDLLPPWPTLLAFVAASFVLAVTPGPGVAYIVTRSLAEGRVSGLASVAGVAAGNLGNAIGASLGLAAILAVSSTAFVVAKYAGAAYLVYLGIRTLRGVARPDEAAAPPRRDRPVRVILDGFMVALLNPKTALFFGAFLPQFMAADSTAAIHSIVLGPIFVAIAAATDTAYAMVAARIAPRLIRGSRMADGGRRLAGGALVGIGLFAAIAGTRAVGHS